MFARIFRKVAMYRMRWFANRGRAVRQWKRARLSFFRLEERVTPAIGAGDVLITGINADDPDQFTFVPMVNIPGSTEINFTDNGWLSAGGFRSGEGVLTWVAPAGGVNAGTRVSISGTSTASLGTVSQTSGSFLLATNGDSLIAFTGTVSSPTPLFALTTNRSVFDTDASNPNTTALPTGLAVGSSAVAVGDTSTDFENADYNNTVTNGTPGQLRAAVGNNANWTKSNTRLTLSTTSFTFTASATVTLDGSNNVVVTGNASFTNTVTIKVVGSNYEITEVSTAFPITTAIAGSSGSGTNVVTVPISGTQINVNLGDRNDQLTVDLTNNFTTTIIYDGGTQTSAPGDSLKLTAGTFTTVTNNHSSGSSGNVSLVNGLGTNSVQYSAIEPIDMTGVTADNLIFNLPAAVSNAVLEGIGGGITRLRSTSASFEQTDFVNPTTSAIINRGNAADTMTVNALADFNRTLSIGTSGAPFSTVSFGGAVSLTGGSSLAAYSSSSIAVNAAVSTANGNLTLWANQGGSPTAGTFIGINVNAVTLQVTGTGTLDLRGKGGNSGASQVGVQVTGGGIISGGTAGTATIIGTGGASSNSSPGSSFGINVTGANSRITSVGASVNVTGTGGGAGASINNWGIAVQSSGTITAGGGGNVTLAGTGGTGSGASNRGIVVTTSGTVTSSGGNVEITGTEGAGGTSSRAIDILTSGGLVTTATNGGNITLIGNSINLTSTTALATNSSGTLTIKPLTAGRTIDLGQATLDVVGGSLNLSGPELTAIGSTTGTVVIGDAATSTISNSQALTAAALRYNLSLVGGAGITFSQPVTMATNKNLSASTTSTSAGTISLPNTTSDLTASGTGTITLTTVRNISMASGSSIETVNGAIMLEANQQTTPTSGDFVGISMSSSLVRSTGNGQVTVLGRGGDTSDDVGINIFGGVTTIQGGTSGTLTVTGTGGANFASHGVLNNGTITSLGANVHVTGFGGNSLTLGDSKGVWITSSGVISAGALGTVLVEGTGSSVGNNNSGIEIGHHLVTPQITSNGGAITLTGTAGPGSNSRGVLVHTLATIQTAANAALNINADSVGVDPTVTISAGTGIVTVRPNTVGRDINLGGADTATELGLTDAELDRITSGTLIIGDNTSGAITVSAAIDLADSANVQLISGGDVTISGAGSFDTNGGTLLLNPGGTDTVFVPHTGTDVTASTLAFGSKLSIGIDGSTPDSPSGYDVLTVGGTTPNGTVDLTGVTLALTGMHVPTSGEVFTIVSATSRVGVFSNLPTNGSTIMLGLVPLTVTYTSTGVTLTAPITDNVTLSGGTLNVDVGAGRTDDITIVRVNIASVDYYQISDPISGNKFSSSIPGSLDSGTNSIKIPIAGVTAIEVFTQDGDDRLTVDFTGGSFTPTIDYDGGAGTNDRLRITGGSFGTITNDYTDADEGQITTAGGTGSNTIQSVGIEPIDMTGSTASDLVFNFPAGGAIGTLDHVSGTTHRLSSSPLTFEQTDFATPSGSVQINRTGGSNSLIVEDLSSFSTLQVGTAGNRFNSVNFVGGTRTFASGKNLSVFTSGLITSTGGTTLSGAGTVNWDAGAHIFVIGGSITTGSGSIMLTGSASQFTGVKIDSGAMISSTSGPITLTGTGGNDTGTVHGVHITGGSNVGGSTTGLVTIIGTGGSAGSATHGVVIDGASSVTASGDVSITGTPGAAAGSVGIKLGDTGSAGTVSTTTAGTIMLIADSMAIHTTTGTINSQTRDTTIRVKTVAVPVDLGSTLDTAGTLRLSDGELDRVTAGTLTIGHPSTGTITVSAAIDQGNNLSLRSGVGITFNQSVAMAAGKSLTAFTEGTISLAKFDADLSSTGSGEITLSTNRNIAMASGSSIATVDGDIELSANWTTTTSGSFVGVDVNNATIGSTTGDISLKGRGGDSGHGQLGVFVQSGGKVGLGTTGTVEVSGEGGASTGIGNFGVRVLALNSEITSGGGVVQVEGSGGGTGSSSQNYGVSVESGGTITNAGMGVGATVTVLGFGGISTGNSNLGVYVIGSSSQITSTGGAVLVKGTGGGTGISSSNVGVYIGIDGRITSAGTTSAVTAKGWGGDTSGGSNYGVLVSALNALVSSSGGPVLVEGTGGSGAGANSNNYGVYLFAGGVITSAGAGAGATVTVHGFGGDTTGANNHGVNLANSGSQITSAGGAVLVEGTGGGLNSDTNIGVNVNDDALITNAGTGVGSTVTVNGFGGSTAGTSGNSNYGVQVMDGGQITSSGGPVEVEGIGGGGNGASGLNYGVHLFSSGAITSTGATSAVTVTGFGGLGTGNSNHGVRVTDSEITSSGGAVIVEGTGGGTGASQQNRGVSIETGGAITAGGIGTVTVDGAGGASTGTGNVGVYLSTNGQIASNGGAIEVEGTGGTGASGFAIQAETGGAIVGTTGTPTVTLIGDSMDFLSTTSINAGGNPVILQTRTAGTLIRLGSSDVLSGAPPLRLGLSGAELNTIISGSLTIGDAASGTLTVSAAIMLADPSNVELVSGGHVEFITGGSFNTNGGTLKLDPGAMPFAVKVPNVGTDATASTVSFGSDLSINVAGTTPDSPTGYDRLTVAGTVDLTGVELQLTGGYALAFGDVFTIVSATSRTGMFSNYTDGQVFIFNSVPVRINYTATGVTLSSAFNIGISGGNLLVDVGNGRMDEITIVRVNIATVDYYQISDPNTANKFYSSIPSALDSGTNSIKIPIGAVTGTQIQIFARDLDDRLTIDFSGGNFADAITYDGGTQTTQDSLSLQGGGTFASVEHFFDSDNDGSVQVTGNSPITYTDLEPVIDNLVAVNRTFTMHGGAETITVTDGTASDGKTMIDSTLGESVYFVHPTNSLTINAGSGSDTITITSVDGGYNASLTINGGTGDDTVNLNADITFASGMFLNVDLQNDDVTPGVDQVNMGADADLQFSGMTGTATIKVSRNISMAAGSSIVTTDGGIVLEANQQMAPTAGNFDGIQVNDAVVESTGTGTISMTGLGGNAAGSSQHGILISGSSALVHGGSGAGTTTTIAGFGGSSTAHGNIGVRLQASATVTSIGGNVSVTGFGGGTGSSNFNEGVFIGVGTVSAGGSGTVNITGTGGSGLGSHGVDVGPNSSVTASGIVTLTGTPGNDGFGVVVGVGGSVTTTMAGNITMIADSMDISSTSAIDAEARIVTLRNKTAGHAVNVGGADSGSQLGLTAGELDCVTAGTIVIGADGSMNYPGAASGTITVSSAVSHAGDDDFVVVTARNIAVNADWTSSNGDLTFLANQQTTPTTGTFFFGVEVNDAAIESMGTGIVTVRGKGGADASDGNTGVYVHGLNGRITGGNVLNTITTMIEGRGGAGTGQANHGVLLLDSGTINSAGGDVSVSGFGGAAAGSIGNNRGVFVGDNSIVTSGGSGDVKVIGFGSNVGGANSGVYVTTGGQISAGGMGMVEVEGTGGNSAAADNNGIYLDAGGQIASSGGDIQVTGNTTPTSHGIRTEGAGQFVATTGSPMVTVIADTMAFNATPSIDAGGNTVTLRPMTAGTLINLGGADVLSGTPLTLGLTDAELDRVTAGSIIVGADNSLAFPGPSAGTVTISQGMSVDGSDSLSVVTGGNIVNAAAFQFTSIALNLRAMSGNIGTMALPIRAGANSLSANASGSVYLIGLAHTNLLASSAGTIFELQAGGFQVDIQDTLSTASMTANGGPIAIVADTLLVSAPVTSQGGGASGDGGTITLSSVVNNLTINSAGSLNASGSGAGNAGDINLTAIAGSIVFQANAQATTTGPGGDIGMTANSIDIATSGATSLSAATVTLKPQSSGTLVNLGSSGGPTVGVLELSDLELDRIAATNLIIGDSVNSGTITISANITRAANTAMQLISTGDVLFSGGMLQTGPTGGSVVLDPGNTGAVRPERAGDDIIGNVSFASDVLIRINGTTVDSNYDRLRVSGTVNLANADLLVTNLGVFSPPNGSVYTIVGATNLIGEFGNQAQGSIVTVNGVPLTVLYDYMAGTVVLKAPDDNISLSGGNLIVDVGNGRTDNITIVRVNISGTDYYQISDSSSANKFYSSISGTLGNGANSIRIPISEVTGTQIQIFTRDGNDTLTVNFSGGNFAHGITYDGGDDTGSPGDSLILTGGGVFAGVMHNFTDNSSGLVGVAGNQPIQYVDLEPIVDELDAVDRTFTFNGGAETITLTDGTSSDDMTMIDSTLGESVYFVHPTNSITINAGSGDDTITVTTVDGGFDASLIVNGGTGDDTVNINGDITFAANKFLDLDLQNDDMSPGVDTVNFGADADMTLSGSGTATIRVSRSISMAAGSSIGTGSGAIVLEANQQATSTMGNFAGISLSGASLASSAGNVTVFGRGGDAGAGLQFGVVLQNGSTISGGAAGKLTNVAGRGGASSGGSNYGVFATGGSNITSTGGDVSVTGFGGGIGAGTSNYGVILDGLADIKAGGVGTVTVEGTGGNSAGGFNDGVLVIGANGGALSSSITSSGSVFVTGIEGTGPNTVAVNVIDSGIISTSSNAALMVTGDTIEIRTIIGETNTISAGTGTVTLRNRTAGRPIDIGGADSATQLGLTDAELDRVVAGKIVIGADGSVNYPGNTPGDINHSSPIQHMGDSDIEVVTRGRIVFSSSWITNGGDLTFRANEAGLGVGTFGGVVFNNNSLVRTTGVGNLLFSGRGGNLSSPAVQDGVQFQTGGRAETTGTGLSSNQGMITIVGIGGSNSSDNDGVEILGNAATGVFSTGDGAISITGTAGVGSNSFGIDFDSAGTIQSSAGSASATITLIADTMDLSAGTVINGGTHLVTLRPKTATTVGVHLGGGDSGTQLGLTDDELDRITSGTLIIGDATSGPITVSQAISLADPSNVQLISGGDVTISGSGSFNTNDGTLKLDSGGTTDTVFVPHVGTDATASAVTFGSNLSINIAGPTPDSPAGYDRLTVAGTVNLTGVTLVLTDTFVPPVGTSYTIVSATSRTGFFTNLASTGSTITHAGVTLTAVYTSTGVTLYAPNVLIDSGNLLVDVGNGRADAITIEHLTSPDRYRITDTNGNIFATTIGGATGNGTNQLVIPASALSSMGNIQVLTRDGDDSLTINLANNFSHAVSYDGGTDTTADSLTLTGGSTFALVAHSLDSPTSGTIDVTGNPQITYTGLEPIFDNLSASDRTFTFNGGSETISVTNGPSGDGKTQIDSTLSESVYFVHPSNSITINAGSGNDTVTITTVDIGFNSSLTINCGVGDDTINLNADITFAANRILDVDLQNDDPTPGVDQVNIGANANLIFSGTGSATIKASRSIAMSNLSSIVTASGGITLAANMQTTPTAGNFAGVTLSNAIIGSATGDILVEGKGGNNSAGSQFGVSLGLGADLGLGTTGTVTVRGFGGLASGGNSNIGVQIFNAGTQITSGGGAVLVEGHGGGVNSSINTGVQVTDGAVITNAGSAATATVTVTGFGGNTTGVGANNNYGVLVFDDSQITSSGGPVLVEGTGGGPVNSGFNYGVLIQSNGAITSAGTGPAATVTVMGFGGAAATAGAFNIGVSVAGTNAFIHSSGGNVVVEGTGGGGNGGTSSGVEVFGGVISSLSPTATVTVKGFGSSTGTDHEQFGVHVHGMGSVITSSGGAVLVEGHGGGAGVSANNHGVFVEDNGVITNAGTGAASTVTVKGFGGNTAGTGSANFGVYVFNAGSQITSGGGAVLVEGTGGGAGTSNSNHGVAVATGGVIANAGTGVSSTVTVKGFGGNTSGTSIGFNHGVFVALTSARITSSGGAIIVEGTGGGSGAGGSNVGVQIGGGGSITAAGTNAPIAVTGIGGNTTGTANVGVLITGASAQIVSGGGAVAITGTGRTTTDSFGIRLDLAGQVIGNVGMAMTTLTADSMNIVATGAIVAGANTVVLKPRTMGTLINLGGSDVLSGAPLTLGLTNAELNQIAAGTLIIGDSTSGSITVSSSITRTASTAMQLISDGDVIISGGSVSTAGGTLLLDPGASPDAVRPTRAGTDAVASTVSFGSDLAFNIAGNTPDTSYDRFVASGAIDLTNAELRIAGAYSPLFNDVFTIVSASGGFGGTQFANAPDGAIIPFNGRMLLVDYTANSVTLSNIAPVDAYVGEASDFAITNDVAPSGLSLGDEVTWNPGGTQHSFGEVTGLSFGFNAFSSIQSAANSAATGAVIRITSGTYASAVTISREVALVGPNVGVNPVTTPVRPFVEAIVNGGAATAITVAVPFGDVVVEGLTLQGLTGVNLNAGAADLAVDDNVVDTTGDGVTAASANSLQVNRNDMNVDGSGIYGTAIAGAVTIEGNRIQAEAHGVYLVNSLSTVTIQGNEIVATNNSGIYLDTVGDHVTIGGAGVNENWIHGDADAIRVSHVTGHVDVLGNDIDLQPNRTGIHVEEITGDLTLQRNDIDGGGVGVYAYQIGGSMLLGGTVSGEGNSIDGFSARGVDARDIDGSFTAKRNTMSGGDIGLSGYLVGGEVAIGSTVSGEGNTIDDVDAGIVVDGAGGPMNAISGNLLTNIANDAIEASYISGDLSISGNDITASDSGIKASYLYGNLIVDNNTIGASDGLYARYIDGDFSVTNNSITATGSGISTGANGQVMGETLIQGNQVLSAQTVGLRLSYLYGPAMIGGSGSLQNTIHGPSEGIQITMVRDLTIDNNILTDISNVGISLSGVGEDGSPAEIRNTSVTGDLGSVGIEIDNGYYYTYAAITGCTISGFTNGIGVSDVLAGGTVEVAIDGGMAENAISGLGGTGTGVLIAGPGASAAINDNDNSISGFAVGIEIDDDADAQIFNNHIFGNTTGIRFTNGGGGSVDGNDFDDAVDNSTDLTLDASAGTVSIGANNAFAGDSRFIVNRSGNNFDLSANGTTFDGASANSLTIGQSYGLEDKLVHAVDAGGYGFIRVRTGHTYSTVNSFDSPTTTTPSVQRAIAAADANDTIHVQSGTTYVGGIDSTTKPLTFDLGSSPGQVTVGGNVVFDGNDTLKVELNGPTLPSFDRLSVNGTVTLGGARLSLSLGYTPTFNNTFTIVDNDDSDAVNGHFFLGMVELVEGAIIVLSDGMTNFNYGISYVGGTGNDVILRSGFAPQGADNTVTTFEDVPYSFTVANFGFSDPNDVPPHAFAAVVVSSLPANGQLRLDGLPVALNQVVPVADIAAGDFQFVPNPNANGTAMAAFTFRVQDDGPPGQNTDPTPNTMTINVTPVNDAPVGADGTVITSVNIPYEFTVADFGFSDPADSPPNQFAGVVLTTLPSNGTLLLAGMPMIAAGTFVPAAAIALGDLEFVPAPMGLGTPYDSFQFQVRDDGSLTGPGAANTDPTPNTIAISVVVPTTVDNIRIGDDTATRHQRSRIEQLTVTFTDVIDLSHPQTVVGDAFRLTRLENASNVVLTVSWQVHNNGTPMDPSDDYSIATITFSAQPNVFARSLIDGNYRFEVRGNALRDRNGARVDADDDGILGGQTELRFYRLFGDFFTSGEYTMPTQNLSWRVVDNLDFASFVATYGSLFGTPEYDSAFDYDGDGDIDPIDSAQFVLSFGKELLEI